MLIQTARKNKAKQVMLLDKEKKDGNKIMNQELSMNSIEYH